MKKKYLIIGIVIILIVSILYIATKIYDKKEASLSGGSFIMMFLDNTKISAENITAGWTSTKTFTIKNESDSSFSYNIVLKNLVNTFVTTGGLQYKITSDNDGYNMSDYADIPKCASATDSVLAYNISIPVGVTQTYTITFRYLGVEDNSGDLGKTLSGTLAITEGTYPKLYDTLLGDNEIRVTPLSGAWSNNENVLFTLKGNYTEDGSTVYYFAGNVQNNWVKFGQDQDGADLYWRIIRTNEDGGIRMLYFGTSPETEAAYINKSAFNSASEDPMYVGYMYGTSGSLENNRLNTTNSVIKTVIDNWYANSLLINKDANQNTYDSYISKTAIYCNDRATASYSTTSDVDYAAFDRQMADSYLNSSYKCGNDETGVLYSNADVADKFSVSTTSGGNGDLTYPIALMTVDEAIIAGGMYFYSIEPWYNYNSVSGNAVGGTNWWSMSPWRYAASFSGALLWNFSSSDYDFGHDPTYEYSVRPVISLKSCVLASGGDGSSSNPYTVEVDSICASAEN